MLRSPTVRDDGTGSAVLVKHATGAERSRLRHEAELLDTIDSEGVVTPVGFDDIDGRCELRLQYLEAATLAEHPPLGLTDVLDVLIAVGTTVAGLHQRGIHHGALSRDHVLLCRPLRPVLCGFGAATGPADSQPHLGGTDLAGIAAIAEAELARTDRAVTSAAERRHCGDALAASRDLAAAAAEAPHDSETLHTWMARLSAIRHAASAALADATGRGLHLVSERSASVWDRRRIATSASAVALVVIAIVGWRFLAGGAAPVSPSAFGPAGAPIGPITPIVAIEPDSPEPDGASRTEPAVERSASAHAPAALDAVDADRDRATLLYGTARPHCSDEVTPATGDGHTSGADCADAQEFADPGHEPAPGLLTLPSGQWALVEGNELPSLSCDVVVVHYGDLNIESQQAATSEPRIDSQEPHG